jgi:signal transduction histidine kinase
VNITLHRTLTRLILTIKDDGRGFDLTNEALRLGHGLANMQARAESLRGSFVLESSPGHGATVTLDLPL